MPYMVDVGTDIIYWEDLEKDIWFTSAYQKW
jgi:hypothetical protein